MIFTRKTKQLKMLEKGKMTYAEYLASPYWKRVRTKVFVHSKAQCHCCKACLLINDWVCHHNSTKAYQRIGREKHKDLWAVCSKCHYGKSATHINLHKDIKVPEWARVKR